jgi:hypothetical protein
MNCPVVINRLVNSALDLAVPHLHLTTPSFSSIKESAAGCGESIALRSHFKRGDLGQLAPRKKLLKSFRVSQKIF